jgi:hypothetical protein
LWSKVKFSSKKHLNGYKFNFPFLPSGLLGHFTITSFDELEYTVTKEKYWEIALEENNVLLLEDAT